MRKWLYEARSKSGLTQKQMGEKLDITEAYYSYIESGERQKKLDITLAAKLSGIFGMTIQQIVELESKKEE